MSWRLDALRIKSVLSVCAKCVIIGSESSTNRCLEVALCLIAFD